jgi:hypothetical protein
LQKIIHQGAIHELPPGVGGVIVMGYLFSDVFSMAWNRRMNLRSM